ncbi:hypothetical protein [Pseudomonas eucalypticola]|uniref:Uncharacterized protein n=1 Tax=Pseudomonas eucalypticola TaxID=2599595 RepID=A0A7D5D8V6_9PSED|nr:hypothetical protein [Pseudomonas eucalypticola]QKZ05840.1 hypothetical protein HWQ56_19380 [Pseudomonas eucalypticola]
MLTVISLLVTCVGVYLTYLNSSPEAKRQAKESTQKLLGSSGRILVGLIVALIAILSATGIVLFWNDEGLIKRQEVVMLILHFMNLAMYGGMCVKTVAKTLAKTSGSSSSDA